MRREAEEKRGRGEETQRRRDAEEKRPQIVVVFWSNFKITKSGDDESRGRPQLILPSSKLPRKYSPSKLLSESSLASPNNSTSLVSAP